MKSSILTRRFAGCALAALSLNLPAIAEDVAEADSEARLETVTVLGDDTNTANPVRLPVSARISSQTLTAEDIVRIQPADVFDLLNVGTGVFTTTTGKKAPSNLNIRGDGNFVFVIDGAYMPSFLASRVLKTLPVIAIEEVRIVRSSTALTLSPLVGLVSPSGAPNNGFIVVRTRQPRETERLARAFIGEHDSYEAGLRLGTTFSLGNGEGYVNGVASYATTEGPDGMNLFRDSHSVAVRAGYAGEQFKLDASLIQTWAAFGFQRSTQKLRDSTYNARWTMDPLDTTTVSLNGEFRWNDQNTTIASVANTTSDGTFRQASYVSPVVTVLDNDNELTNFNLRHTLSFGGTKITGGGDFVSWHTPTDQFYYEGLEREDEVFGYFLQAEQGLLDDRLNLDVGGRIDQVTIVTGFDYYLAGRGPTNPVRIKDRELPEAKFLSAGASYELAEDWLLNVRYGYSSQGARQDVTPFPGVVLEGETREKFELGFEGKVTDWLRPSINYFQVETTNEAAPRDYVTVAGVQIARYDNTDSKRTGAEAVLAGDWTLKGGAGGYRVSATHYFDVLDPSGLLARTQPDTVAEIQLIQDLGQWSAALLGKYVEEYESNAFGRCTLPGGECSPAMTPAFLPIGNYSTLDFTLSRDLTLADVDMKLTFSARNLTDETYETSLGYPNPGRMLGIELLADF